MEGGATFRANLRPASRLPLKQRRGAAARLAFLHVYGGERASFMV